MPASSSVLRATRFARLSLATILSTIAAAGVRAQEPELPEPYDTAVLDAPGPHRVYVSDVAFTHLVASKIYVLRETELLGQISSGFVSNLLVAPDDSELYVVETYWSRGTRGDRTDVVTIYDPRTLEPKEELILPNGRFLVVPKKHSVALSADGRYLLSFNMFPGTTVDVIDIRERRFLKEIEIPGCTFLYPWGQRHFSMICADGSLFSVEYGADGAAISTATSEPFFDPDTDPVLEHPAVADGRYYFVSYGGTVHPVDVRGDAPAFDDPFSLLTAADEEAGWWPGGWQVAAVHEGTNRLYTLMHQGAPWSHKQAGAEVWVYDLNGRDRVGRLVLAHAAISIEVTQDAEARLFALGEEGTFSVYDARSLQYLGSVEGIGETPLGVTVGR